MNGISGLDQLRQPSFMNSKIPWIAYAALAFTYVLLMFSGLPLALLVILKVLPIALLIGLALRQGGAPVYLPIALFFSGCGDTLLALPHEAWFVYGLAAFLLAQVTYAAGFFRARRATIDSQAKRRLMLIAVFMSAIAVGVLPASGDLLIPVVAYFLAISAMACTAALHRYTGLILFAGAFIFVVSDSIIAINKFVMPFEGARHAIMLSYYAAQGLIVKSVLNDSANQHEFG